MFEMLLIFAALGCFSFASFLGYAVLIMYIENANFA